MIECMVVLEAQKEKLLNFLFLCCWGYESVSYGQASIGYESVQIGEKRAKFALFGINLKWCIEWWLSVWRYWSKIV